MNKDATPRAASPRTHYTVLDLLQLREMIRSIEAECTEDELKTPGRCCRTFSFQESDREDLKSSGDGAKQLSDPLIRDLKTGEFRTVTGR